MDNLVGYINSYKLLYLEIKEINVSPVGTTVAEVSHMNLQGSEISLHL